MITNLMSTMLLMRNRLSCAFKHSTKRLVVYSAYLVAAVLFPISSCCYAGVYGYVKGDFYFRTLLTKSICNKLSGGGVHYFIYDRGDSWEGTRHIGTQFLSSESFSNKQIATLIFLYNEIREHESEIAIFYRDKNGVKTPKEYNPPLLFVFTEKVDPSIIDPLLKYNEDWSKHRATRGIPNRQSRPDEIFKDKIIDSWRLAHIIPGFEFSVVPANTITLSDGRIIERQAMKANSACCYMLITQTSFEFLVSDDYSNTGNEKMYYVDESGVITYYSHNGEHWYVVKDDLLDIDPSKELNESFNQYYKTHIE